MTLKQKIGAGVGIFVVLAAIGAVAGGGDETPSTRQANDPPARVVDSYDGPVRPSQYRWADDNLPRMNEAADAMSAVQQAAEAEDVIAVLDACQAGYLTMLDLEDEMLPSPWADLDADLVDAIGLTRDAFEACADPSTMEDSIPLIEQSAPAWSRAGDTLRAHQ